KDMETKERQSTTDTTLLVKIADKLLEAQREIDELVLQCALGKAEARDTFEEAKKEFRSRVGEFKTTSLGAKVSGLTSNLKGSLEELDVQLSLGKADSKEMFEEQKKKIEVVINKLRSELKEIKDEVFDREHLEHEIETFKLKMEVLRLRFELKKFEVRDSFKSGMQQVKRKIEQTASKLNDKLSTEKNALEVFREESRDVYKRLRKVIESIK
ncbi:MAG TPA: hypothetical protein VF141_21955, partial [Chryseolinea sp.]